MHIKTHKSVVTCDHTETKCKQRAHFHCTWKVAWSLRAYRGPHPTTTTLSSKPIRRKLHKHRLTVLQQLPNLLWNTHILLVHCGMCISSGKAHFNCIASSIFTSWSVCSCFDLFPPRKQHLFLRRVLPRWCSLLATSPPPLGLKCTRLDEKIHFTLLSERLKLGSAVPWWNGFYNGSRKLATN